jgi:hypothetical protein
LWKILQSSYFMWRSVAVQSPKLVILSVWM